MAAGVRVIRGPDWNLGDSDGGEGHVGTVQEMKDKSVAKILWDGGQVTECRASKGQGYDLRVLDNATVGVRHSHIVCDECGESNIVGIRWNCSECVNYDLCSVCYFSDKHDNSHQFFRIEAQASPKVKQEKRSKSMKMRVLGIFPDATVVRGKDWEWKDQDGGQGQTGTVLDLLSPATNSARNTVKVKWENGITNVYRVGFKGKVDLQYTEEAPGIECYPDHLPVFDADNYKEEDLSSSHTSDKIEEGDTVVIAVNQEQLKELQKDHSGWAVSMGQCIGRTGKVQGFATNGDVTVSFGNKKYRMNPAALKKVSSVTVGSHVRILDDEEKVKMLQDGHGGYNERMRSCLGKVGKVIKIDGDGDMVVQFGERHWVFAPACCIAAPDSEVDFIPSQDGGVPIKLKLGDNGNEGDLLGIFQRLAEAAGQLAGDVVFLKAIADKEEDDALGMLSKQPKLAKSGTESLMTALHIAANRGLMRLTTALLDGGAEINSKDKDGDTPLMAALSGGCDKVSVLLVNRGCDVNIRNNDGQTAGHKAAIAGFTNVMEVLCSHGADLNAQDNSRDTPLHDSISTGHTAVAEQILAWPKLDLHRTNKKGHPPLHFACMKDEPEIVDRILQKDRSLVNMQKEDGWTALHVCACNNHVRSMRILIEKGSAKVNMPNKEKQSPLHVAAHEAALDCVKLLVQHGADVNGRDGMGNTPLHVTLAGLAMGTEELGLLLLMMGQSNKVKETVRTQLACFLVQHGADPHAKNNIGIQAIDTCPMSHNQVKEAVKKFIVDNGCATRVKKDSLSSPALPGDVPSCTKCLLQEAQVLMVPCGHRVLCRECITGIDRCPKCGQQIKQMFDQDGRRVKDAQCILM